MEKVDEAMSFKVDPQKIAAILDKAMYKHIFDVCREKEKWLCFRIFHYAG